MGLGGGGFRGIGWVPMDLTVGPDTRLIIQAMICGEPHLTKAWELDSPPSTCINVPPSSKSTGLRFLPFIPTSFSPPTKAHSFQNTPLPTRPTRITQDLSQTKNHPPSLILKIQFSIFSEREDVAFPVERRKWALIFYIPSIHILFSFGKFHFLEINHEGRRKRESKLELRHFPEPCLFKKWM